MYMCSRKSCIKRNVLEEHANLKLIILGPLKVNFYVPSKVHLTNNLQLQIAETSNCSSTPENNYISF